MRFLGSFTIASSAESRRRLLEIAARGRRVRRRPRR
jgi:hypothetical protein